MRIILLFLILPALLRAADINIARAGWAEIDITPRLGIALGGRGGADAQSDKVLDPLMAQALLLQDPQSNRFVLISLDLVGLQHDFSDRVRASIAADLGMPMNLVLLNCSHTHSGPLMYRALFAGIEPTPPEELDFLRDLELKIISISRKAEKNLRPVQVQTFSGKSNFGINRRGKNPQGNPGILPDPNGPMDEQVWILKVAPIDQSPGALVFSYACHPVMVYGFDYRALSADFPGAARAVLKERLG